MDRPSLGRLLLVEDEQALRLLVAQYLRTKAFQVVEACDGPEAVSSFTDEGPFDLVLMDLNLPGFSGVEACRRIREHAPMQRVMICSAAVLPEHESALDDLGVDRRLTKPYHPRELVETIREELSFATALQG